jgi:hypothetical protein
MDNRQERRGNNMNATFAFSPIIIAIAIVIASIVFVRISSTATNWKAGRVFMDEPLPIKRLGLSTHDLVLAMLLLQACKRRGRLEGVVQQFWTADDGKGGHFL